MSKEMDRRKYPRLHKSFKVEIKKLEFPLKSQKLLETKCLNISSGGIFLKTSEPFKVDDVVHVIIYIIGFNMVNFTKVILKNLKHSQIKKFLE